MHEEIESVKTKLHAARVGEKSVLDDLFSLRDRMLKMAATYDKSKEFEIEKKLANPRTYTGPADDYADPVKARKLRAKELKAKGLQEWRGIESVEMICEMFTTFLTTPTALSALKLEVSTPYETVPVPSGLEPAAGEI